MFHTHTKQLRHVITELVSTYSTVVAVCTTFLNISNASFRVLGVCCAAYGTGRFLLHAAVAVPSFNVDPASCLTFCCPNCKLRDIYMN